MGAEGAEQEAACQGQGDGEARQGGARGRGGLGTGAGTDSETLGRDFRSLRAQTHTQSAWEPEQKGSPQWLICSELVYE